jgi:glutathione peroxidase
MFEKTRVKAPDAHPFYESLARETGKRPRWNFHKYLISREGKAVGSYGSTVTPRDRELVQAIESELARPAPKR